MPQNKAMIITTWKQNAGAGRDQGIPQATRTGRRFFNEPPPPLRKPPPSLSACLRQAQLGQTLQACLAVRLMQAARLVRASVPRLCATSSTLVPNNLMSCETAVEGHPMSCLTLVCPPSPAVGQAKPDSGGGWEADGRRSQRKSDAVGFLSASRRRFPLPLSLPASSSVLPASQCPFQPWGLGEVDSLTGLWPPTFHREQHCCVSKQRDADAVRPGRQEHRSRMRKLKQLKQADGCLSSGIADAVVFSRGLVALLGPMFTWPLFKQCS